MVNRVSFYNRAPAMTPAQQAYRTDPRVAMAQALMAQGGSTAPVQSWGEGAARMLQAGVGGYFANQARQEMLDREAKAATDMKAALAGAQAKPWVNPDTGQVAPDQPPTGGMDGMMAALMGSNNPDLMPLAQELQMQMIARQQARQDDLRRRDLDIEDYDVKKGIDQKYAPPPDRRIIKGADGYNYFADDGTRVLENVEKPPAMPFEGKGVEAQALNLYMTLSEKQNQGIALTPLEQKTLDLARQRLERQSTLATPQGTYVQPGYNLGPRNETPPSQGFDKLNYKPGEQPAWQPQTPGPAGFYPKATAEQEGQKAEAKKRAESGGVLLTPAEKTADEAFAKEYTDLVATGGLADVQKNLGQLDEVIATLKGGNDSLTGPVIGNVPDGLKATFFPDAATTQDAVEEVVQRNLRLVLGAQFTEKEGQRLIARAYNPRLGEAENAKRVQRLRDSIAKAFDAKMKAAQYYEQNGTLKGYKGSLAFTMDDIEAASSEPDAGMKVWNPATRKFEDGAPDPAEEINKRPGG